ncbi:MAG: XRE family transcriptional regulator [Gammaproteobacteria bacterium]|nr:MAG: XRE family transcriptional regulator [Gammaproteobacteria bacterium]
MADLAEKIDLLFRTFTRPDGREYTYKEVELGTQKAVTDAYVWKLRMGQATNPSYRVLRALAAFFQVPLTYFFEDDLSPEYLEDLKLAAALRDSQVAEIALRVADLDERGLQAVREMVEYVRKAQGLNSTIQDEEP